MARTRPHLHAFNTGEVSRAGLVRVDIEKMRLAAEVQENLLPHVIGKAMMRPGTTYLGNSRSNNRARSLPFYKRIDVTAELELTAAKLRVWVDDALVTRPSVTSSVTNGDFSSSTGWTLTVTGSATADINSTVSGSLWMACSNRGGTAACTRSVSTSSAGTQHALRIDVTRGPVTFRCGSTSGGDDYIEETVLATGIHSLAFTPSGTYHVHFASRREPGVIVNSITVESSGVMELDAPWSEDELREIRFDQSGDIVFLAHENWQQRKIERRGDASWSLVLYQADDGPFTTDRTAKVRLKPAATRGNTTLTADGPFFRPEHVGALFRLNHRQSDATFTLAAEETYTDAIRLRGIGPDNDYTYIISGTWSGTLTQQRSLDGPDGPWVDTTSTHTTNGSITTSSTSEWDNLVHWVRIGFRAGAYTSGVASVRLTYSGQSGYGIGRVTAYTSETQVSVEVLADFKHTVYTDDWQEGEWSDRRGWPSAVAFHDGRLVFAGADRIYASESDDFEAFNLETEGDAGSIQRDIATSGGADKVNFLLPLTRLIVGTDGSEVAARSDAFDAPITPTRFSLKDAETLGVSKVSPVKFGKRGLYVPLSGTELAQLVYNFEAQDYESVPIGELNEDYGGTGLLDLAVQRTPEPYVWAVRADGQGIVVLFSPRQQIEAIVRFVTDGEVESVCVLKGNPDRVYLWVKRTVNGSTVRFHEKLALHSEAIGSATCKLSDAGVFNAGPVSTFTGLSHLEGERVLVWANGVLLNNPDNYTVASDGTVTIGADFTVASGQISLGASYSNVFVGLPYTGRYKSSRLAYGAQGGTALLQHKRVPTVGLLLENTHRKAIRCGDSFDALTPLELRQATGQAISASAPVKTIHDDIAEAIGGTWSTDSRVCAIVQPGLPGTLMGLVMTVETHEG